MVNFQKQRGSVVLGFVAGVVAGLVIAVIVALIVTKSSIPYSQKYVRQGKIAASAVSASVPADPNKSLYTTPAADKDAEKSSAKASASQTSRPSNAATKQPSAATAKSDDDPIAAVIRRDAAAKSAPAHKIDTNGDERWTYMLQTNAYRDPAEAENERGKLALAGFDANIMQVTINGAVLYRVRLGPFKNMDEMNQTRSRLASNGMNAAIVRIPKK